uniref:PNPLA domain-containing protein n=1 Tax=viral metagenome TaxID=1070528 RepID=A0A6C0HHW2_9ZZZZ
MSNKTNTNTKSTLLMREYIKALLLNVDLSKLKKEINLIFDGGAFNGGFAAGVAMYVKALEEQELVKIDKVSGCSIGSAIALWYVCGCQEEAIRFFEQMTIDFQDTLNLVGYHKNIKDFVHFLFPDGNVSTLKDKLYINFYDTQKHAQNVVSEFKDVDHLIDCILQSSHLPYIIDGNARYKGRYIDGILPHIFNGSGGSSGSSSSTVKNDGSTTDSLFIKLLTLHKCSRAMVVKCEANIHYRLLSGIADANEFFTIGSSDMCSYVSQWSYFNILQIRCREMVILFIISMIEWIILVKNNIPSTIKNSLLYNGCVNSIKGLCCDVLRRTII